MNTLKSQAPQILFALIVIFFAALAILRTFNGTQGAFQEQGAWDFYWYWYNGLLVRPGSQWAYPLDPNPVSLTPPLLFVMSLFSSLPYSLARFIWIPFNVSLVVVIPWLVLYLLPIKLAFRFQVLIALMFYGMTGTSIAIRAGNPTMLVLFLIVLTLVFVRQGKKVLPGIIFGLALSKIAFAIPILLFLVYKRRWSVVITSLGVQILGLLALALLVNVSPLTIIDNYRHLATISAESSYINLIHLAGHFPHSEIGFIGIGLVITILVFGGLWWGVVRHEIKSPTPELWDYSLFAVLNLWGLLAAFHAQYDGGVSIFGIALLVSAMSHPKIWKLSSSQTKWLVVITAVSLIGIVGLPPGLSYIGEIRPIWAPIRWRLLTAGPLLLLLTTIWLWRQGILGSEDEA